MSHAKRFKNRKKGSVDCGNITSSTIEHMSRVEQILSAKSDTNALEEFCNIIESAHSFESKAEIPESEAKEFLATIEKNFNQQQFDNLISTCRNNVISAIVTPFGIGGFIAEYDKKGGNVDTIHNVRSIDPDTKIGIYATDEAKSNYEARGDYNSTAYHGHKQYIAKNREIKEACNAGTLTDAYTGKPITLNEKRNLDHTISAKNIHDDAGRVLAGFDGPELANQNSNLNPTIESINLSKKQKSMDEYLDWTDDKIKNLNEKKELNDKDKKFLNKLEQREIDIDPNRTRKIDEKARKEYNGKINSTYYTSKKFTRNLAETGAKEGFKMGIQQAFGIVLYEFFQASFDEITDIYHHGLSKDSLNDNFISEMKIRIPRVAKRVSARWKDAFDAFQAGFLSGFLSNLVTVIINSFITTGKRIVRILREGSSSLFKAVKILYNPSEGMSSTKAAHEASKIIAAGLVIVGGIGIEQSIDNLIKTCPPILPLSGIINAVITGALTGIATTFTVYMIDKVDLLKVNSNERHETIMTQMESKLEQLFIQGDILVNNMSS